MRYGYVVLLLVGIGICLSGCGSNSTEPPIDQVLEPRIQEYVGDGGGSLKPWPDFLGPLAADSPSAVAPKLKLYGPPKTGKVARKQVSWYRLQAQKGLPAGSYTYVIVTLQPTADEDSDLYVLEGRGSNFDDGAGLTGSSRRAPTSPEHGAWGYAPDWTRVQTTNTAGWPIGHVAVFGVNEAPAVKHFRIEVDGVWPLPVGGGPKGGSVPRYDSNWWGFTTTSGNQYTLDMKVTAGDPDIFVYENEATEFITRDTGTGDAVLVFTATASGWHFVRIYGYGATPNSYTLELTSP